MDHCMLCLQKGFNEYIPINSPQWLQFKVLGKIEQHFWHFDNVENILGICYSCWSKLNEFHMFYKTIEEAHHINIQVCKKELPTNCLLKLPHNSEAELDDIRIKETQVETEPVESFPLTITPNGKDSNQILTQKRKRGRPPKKQNLIQMPKRKRGRPRKLLPPNHSYSTNETFQKSGDFIGSTPPKVKRGRGRPRKMQLNSETSNSAMVLDEVAICSNEKFKDEQCTTHQAEGDTQNGRKKSHNKQTNIFSQIMQRKRMKQHKALMRNYIATSVRCMQFLRND